MKKQERRNAPRERLEPIAIRGFTSLDHKTLLSRSGYILEASSTGFMLHIPRKEIVPPKFRDAISLHELEGDHVILTIDVMDLEISGQIIRTKRINKETYEIAIDFSEDAPEYWREALIDMLPRGSDYDD